MHFGLRQASSCLHLKLWVMVCDVTLFNFMLSMFLLSFYVKQEKAIELLVHHGADLDSRTPYGESPLGMG